MTDTTAEAPALTPEMVRALMRGHLTVVKSGETLVMTPDRNLTPNQLREMQQMLDSWHREGDLPFRVIALPGTDFAPVAEDDGPLTFSFEGGKLGRGTPVVNGYPVSSATAVTVKMGAQELPQVTLALIPLDGLRLLLAGAQVSVDDQTREALVSLGWTPPEEAA